MLFLSLFSGWNYISFIRNSDTKILDHMIGIDNWISYLGEAVNSIVSVTLICLIVGIIKNKLSLMKPYKIIYLIFIILLVVMNAYIMIITYKFFKNVTDKDVIKYYSDFHHMFVNSKENIEQDIIGEMNSKTNHFKDKLETRLYNGLAKIIISLFINLIYYFTTNSYIHDVEKEEKEIENVKNIENAN